jgi:pimeloyl-ACP methyl ester carboxylesterase
MGLSMILEHKFTLVDDVNIHYVESCSYSAIKKGKPTLIFLHGFPEYWGTWTEQLHYFSTNYRVIAPDLPGYNLSDKPSDSTFYTLPNLITFIAKFIQFISPEKQVYLVAHDWGGVIAWPLAAFHPKLISKLIILNAAHPSTFTREMANNPIQRQKSAYIHQLISSSGESLLSKNNFQYLSETMMVSSQTDVFTDEIKARYRQVWQQKGAVNGMLQYYRAMPQLAPSNTDSTIRESGNAEPLIETGPVMNISAIRVPNIRVNLPTLILWGEEDQAFVNENLDDISLYVPNCTLIRFPNTSHWLQHEKPTAVNNAIARFIST